MSPYIPTVAAATAATSIFHLTKVLPAPTAATLAQLSTAVGLFVLRSAATTPEPEAHRQTFMHRRELGRWEDEAPSLRSAEGQSYFSADFIKEKLSQAISFLPSRSDLAWTALSTGVLAGIGYFFQGETRTACFKAGAAMGLLQGVIHWWQPDLLTALSSQDKNAEQLDEILSRLDTLQHQMESIELRRDQPYAAASRDHDDDLEYDSELPTSTRTTYTPHGIGGHPED